LSVIQKIERAFSKHSVLKYSKLSDVTVYTDHHFVTNSCSECSKKWRMVNDCFFLIPIGHITNCSLDVLDNTENLLHFNLGFYYGFGIRGLTRGLATLPKVTKSL